MAKTVKKKKVVLGWHFLPKDMKLGYSDNRKAEVGKTLTVTGSPDTCHFGLHASHKPAHAAHFKKGPIMCRVQVWGEVDDDGQKFAGQNRHILWAKELTAKDLKALYKDIGFHHYETEQNGLVSRMNNLISYAYEDKANKWLESWAKKNGCEGKVQEIVFTPKQVTEKEVLKFLSPTFLRTKEEIAVDMGAAYDCDGNGTGGLDALQDVLDELGWADKVVEAEEWKQSSSGYYQSGYALKVKRAVKRKR